MKIFIEASDIGKRDDIVISIDLDGRMLNVLASKKVRNEYGATETRLLDILHFDVGEENK